MTDWLSLCLVLMTDGGTQSVVQEQTHQSTQLVVNSSTKESSELQPSKELLLFLAEWDETQDGQWIEPSAFAENSALGQRMEQQNQTKNSDNHENYPDYN